MGDFLLKQKGNEGILCPPQLVLHFFDGTIIRVIVGYAGINKIYKPKPPTVVALLLRYSSSRVEHKDVFSSHK